MRKAFKILVFITTLFYLIHVNSAFSTEYYVDRNNPQASNSNSGTNGSPWLTIQHAANIMGPGDICYVKDGIYNEVVQPQNSGNVGRLITFMADGNVTMRGFRIINKTYIRIIGFEITHINSNIQQDGIYLLGAHGSEILDNYIHHTYGLGIWQHHAGFTNNALIRGNRMEYISSTIGRKIGDIGIYIHGNKNIVEYNDISHVADFINIWGENNIIRNNYFHDCYLSDFPDYASTEGHHIDGIQYFSPHLNMLLTRTLVENNIFYKISVPHAHIILLQDDEKDGSSELIFRNNVGNKIGSYLGGAVVFDGLRILNNTFVDLLETQTPKAQECVSFRSGATGGRVINNIFYNSARDGGSLYYVDATSATNFYADYNLAYLSGNPHEIHGILDRNPQFKDYGNNNLYLKYNSPAINAAGPLTTTNSSNTGINISVRDAGYFMDGWSIAEGDYIRVGSNDSLKIISVDYNNNIITVNRSISWNMGDEVNYVYHGTAPEMGAFEYREDENYKFDIKIIKPFNYSHVNGTVIIEAKVANEDCIRFVIFSINGIPVEKKSESPFLYIWKTDGLPFGNYKIEARAYAYHASTGLVQSNEINLNVVDSIVAPPSNLHFIK